MTFAAENFAIALRQIVSMPQPSFIVATSAKCLSLELEIGRQPAAVLTQTLDPLSHGRLAADRDRAGMVGMNLDVVALLQTEFINDARREPNRQAASHFSTRMIASMNLLASTLILAASTDSKK
nr:hypothetical protein [Burkholderia sp. SRS-W-2-2016]